MPIVIHMVNGQTLQPKFSPEEDAGLLQAFQNYLTAAPADGAKAPSGCRFHLVGNSPSYVIVNFAHVTHILENPNG